MRKSTGCYECSQRRIRCDERRPVCQKCQKKGIECSGPGAKFRFVERGSKSPPKRVDASLVNQVKSYETVQVPVTPEAPVRDVSEEYIEAPAQPDRDVVDISHECSRETTIYRPVKLLDNQTQMLFSHFNKYIAPNMVVFDSNSNGWRNVILPFAFADDFVRQAVCITAAHHRAGLSEGLHVQSPAKHGQLQLISKMRQHAEMQTAPNSMMTMSHWMALLILLTCETITGGEEDFVYLLEALKYFDTCSESDFESQQEGIYSFLREQTAMFRLCGSPLVDESRGQQVLEQNIDDFLGFMDYKFPPASSMSDLLKCLRVSWKIACQIYRLRSANRMTPDVSNQLLDQLRIASNFIDHKTPGAHALVWVYFIGAAESSRPQDQEFFTRKLGALFCITRFRTIPAALETLKELHAAKQSHRWTKWIVKRKRLLVM